MLAGSPEQDTLSSFQIDLPGGRLLHGSKPIEIRPKALAVLKYLADHSGQLVTKQQILQAVWPDVHVDDAVLKVTIREIRKALDDPSREPRFIETAHRQGYRFIGSIGQRQGAGAGIAAAPHSPETRYSKSGDVSIAYQVLGEGPPDLVFVMGWVSHLEYFWTEPSFAAFLRRLASFSRLILFDKRGTGLSDEFRRLSCRRSRRGWTMSGPSWTRWALSAPCCAGCPRARQCRRYSPPPIRRKHRRW